LVAVVEQAGGDRVAVGLVVDQNAAEVSASRLMKAGKKVKAGAGTPVSRGVDGLVIGKPAPAFVPMIRSVPIL
jgi:hypothetical protein